MIVRGHEGMSRHRGTPVENDLASTIQSLDLRDEDPKVCPYCGRRPPPASARMSTRMIMFSWTRSVERKTVRACKRCNDHFGGTFEAQNLKDTIIRISILLAQAGVAIAKKGLKWKNAVSTPEGLLYNLVLTTDAVFKLSPQSLSSSATLVIQKYCMLP